MEQLVKDFYEILTDRQLIIFCLLYGYNERGITLTITEIAQLLTSKVPSVWQANQQVTYKLSQPRFRPLVERMRKYE